MRPGALTFFDIFILCTMKTLPLTDIIRVNCLASVRKSNVCSLVEVKNCISDGLSFRMNAPQKIKKLTVYKLKLLVVSF